MKNLNDLLPKPKWHRRDKILAFGFLLPLMVFGIYAMLSDTNSSESPDSADTPTQSEDRATGWSALDTETRKSLVQTKLRDCEQLQSELESILRRANRGDVTIELIGEVKTWKHGVDFIEREMTETGFKPGLETSGTAMGTLHGSLQSMKFAWDRFERAMNASSSAERQDHASAHANELKLMRNNIEYARQWMERGQY